VHRGDGGKTVVDVDAYTTIIRSSIDKQIQCLYTDEARIMFHWVAFILRIVNRQPS
jgi:hypothetical protein